MNIISMFSAKILFFLITSTFFLQYTSQEKQIRGLPEVDYPTYYVIPKTSFRCSDQLYNPGFYADTEARCQVFHYCYEHRQESFLCPMGTIFNQPILACDYWYSFNCSLAPSYYSVNADKSENQFDEVDDSLNSPSENLFDKMAHLYEIKKASESSASVKNASDASGKEFLSRDDVESSDEPSIEQNNKTEDYNIHSYNDQFNMVDEKHPEVVKYEVSDLNTLNIYKGSEKEQLYETDNVQDFIFSEDGMLHQSQDDIYQMNPNDMNFNQEYNDYVEIPNEGNMNYDLNELDPEGDYQISEFELHKRYADTKGDYVRRRPSSRKPVIVIPEAEPEIVQLPVVKHKRKPIGIASTTNTNEDIESSHETNYDSSVYKDTASTANEVIESTAPYEFPLVGHNSDLNAFELGHPKLFYENQEETNDENGSPLHQTDSLSAIYEYSSMEETQNGADKISFEVFGSGNNDFLGVSNAEHRSTFMDSKYGDESGIFIGDAEGSTVLPISSEISSEGESGFDNDPFLGSGSENINSHSRDRSSFPEDQDIFSDNEDTEITDTEAPYVLPINLSDAFEGSGISVQETSDMSNFNEVNEPNQFVFKDYEDGIKHGKESSFSSEFFNNFSPLENSEDNEELEFVPEGSGGFNGFSYLPHEVQESSDNLHDVSDKMVPEIREINGSYYYVFSDSGYHSNFEYDDSSGFNFENVDYALSENFDDISDKTAEEFIDNEESSPTDSKIKIDNIENDSLDSGHLENTYEKLSDELEVGTSSDISEEYIVDGSDDTRQLSTEDLKYLEIVSQNPSTMMKNLFDVSNEKSSSDAIKEKHRHEIISPEQDINEQSAIREDPATMEEGYEFDSVSSDTTDIEHSADIESSENISEILNVEQNAEEVSNTGGSGEDASEVLSLEQNLEAFVPGREADPFNPLFAESDELLLESPGRKPKLSLKVPPVPPKIAITSPVMGKNLKKTAKGRSLNENLRTFNPPNKGKPLTVPSRETFRETMFTSIPSTFLKMKHSTLRPYFYDYDVKKSGINPRTGDLLQSSKFSKLTSLGKRLLAAKSAKFNRMKKYIDSYRN